MKYPRRKLNQVENLKQFGEDSLNRISLHDPNTDKQRGSRHD